MLGAVAGYYNGEHIVLNEKVCWDNGQEVVVTVMPKRIEKPRQGKLDFAKFRSGGRYGIDKDAQDYVEELRANDRI